MCIRDRPINIAFLPVGTDTDVWRLESNVSKPSVIAILPLTWTAPSDVAVPAIVVVFTPTSFVVWTPTAFAPNVPPAPAITVIVFSAPPPVAVIFAPTKLSVVACVDNALPSSLIVIPDMIPVSCDPSPLNWVAVTTPVMTAPWAVSYTHLTLPTKA